MAIGLGQSGDTAAHGKLWRGEEQEDQEMQPEQPEGIAEGSEHKAPSHPQPQAGAKLNSEENAEAEEEEAERPTTRRAPKGPTQREREPNMRPHTFHIVIGVDIVCEVEQTTDHTETNLLRRKTHRAGKCQGYPWITSSCHKKGERQPSTP